MKDTLYLEPLKFKPVASDRLFYDRWRYCVKFYLPEITALRDSLDPIEIRRVIRTRQEWRAYARHRWPAMNVVADTGFIDELNAVNLVNFAGFLTASGQDYKMTISVNHAWLYSNDLKFIEELTQLSYLKIVKLTQAEITRARDCVELRNPQHTQRSYFRSAKLTSEQKQNLRNFLYNQTDIRISSGLESWLNDHWSRTQDYFFVDHNGSGFETMLGLVAPQIIRKTLPIMAK